MGHPLLFIGLIYYDLVERENFGEFKLYETVYEDENALHIFKNGIALAIIEAQGRTLKSVFNVIAEDQNSLDYLAYVNKFDGVKTIQSSWIGNLDDESEFELLDENLDGIPNKKVIYDKSGNVIEEFTLGFQRTKIEQDGARDGE